MSATNDRIKSIDNRLESSKIPNPPSDTKGIDEWGSFIPNSKATPTGTKSTSTNYKTPPAMETDGSKSHVKDMNAQKTSQQSLHVEESIPSTPDPQTILKTMTDPLTPMLSPFGSSSFSSNKEKDKKENSDEIPSIPTDSSSSVATASQPEQRKDITQDTTTDEKSTHNNHKGKASSNEKRRNSTDQSSSDDKPTSKSDGSNDKSKHSSQKLKLNETKSTKLSTSQSAKEGGNSRKRVSSPSSKASDFRKHHEPTDVERSPKRPKINNGPSTSKRKSSLDDLVDSNNNNQQADRHLFEEATKLKHVADKTKSSEPGEALDLYLQAGMKYLEHCHSLEMKHVNGEAEQMYRSTADFFEKIAGQSREPKNKNIMSLCYTCEASSLAKSLTLRHERVRQLKEVVHQLEKSGAVSPGSPSSSSHELSKRLLAHLKDLEDMVKYFDMLYKAEQMGSTIYSIPNLVVAVKQAAQNE